MLTIAMYHYVGFESARFPNRKQLLVPQFESQLDRLSEECTFVGMSDVVSAVKGGHGLPPNACLLTFDDGLRDHADHVFPILADRGIPAVFFVPAGIFSGSVLAVHRIQAVLAATIDHDAVAGRLDELLDDLKPGSAALARSVHGAANRFDSGPTVYVKNYLQRSGHPDRDQILDALVDRFVSGNSSDLAGELYLDRAQIATMRAAGYEFGGHTDQHDWLSDLDEAALRREIERSRELVQELGGNSTDWTFAYPYGDCPPVSRRLLDQLGCAVALTTESARATDLSSPLILSRLDCVDLPR